MDVAHESSESRFMVFVASCFGEILTLYILIPTTKNKTFRDPPVAAQKFDAVEPEAVT